MLRFFDPLRLRSGALQMIHRRHWENVVVARPPVRQQEVVDRSVLRMTGGSQFLNVIDRESLRLASSKISGGRSKGRKLMRELPTGVREFYYFKFPYYRWGFVKELVVGALARHLMGRLAPQIYAVELSEGQRDGYSRYALASQSLGSQLHYDNLESWAFLYKEDDEEGVFDLKHLGCSLAFKLLLGDSDAKAANIVMLMGQSGHCYSIDHEYAFDRGPQFIASAREAVRQLKDFELDGVDHLHLPLQADPELLEKIEPVLTRAVQRDIDNGAVMQLYQQFAALSLRELRGLFNQFGPLIYPAECDLLLKDLLARQRQALNFVVKHDSNKLPFCELSEGARYESSW